MLSWEDKQFLSGDKIVEHLVVSKSSFLSLVGVAERRGEEEKWRWVEGS